MEAAGRARSGAESLWRHAAPHDRAPRLPNAAPLPPSPFNPSAPPSPPGVTLFGALAEKASFVGADLSGADLESGNFDFADFTNANLSGAMLTNTQVGARGPGKGGTV
jgi:hypothetical protein